MFLFSCFSDNTDVISENSVLIDVRTVEEFSNGSVEGAVNIPLSTIESQIGTLNKADPIVVFCRSGGRSGKAKKILDSNGFTNVANGGGWKSVKKKVATF